MDSRRICEELSKGGLIHIKSIKTLRPTIHRKYDSPIIKAPTTLLSKKVNHIPTNTDANKELKDLFGIPPFDYSKPVKLLQFLINSKTYSHKQGWVLDFFAGSGSTAHATLQQNAEDDGSRKYCLIENTDVFFDVLLPRLEKLIISKSWKDGIPTDQQGFTTRCKILLMESYRDILLNLSFEINNTPIPDAWEHIKRKSHNSLRLIKYIIKWDMNKFRIQLDPAEFSTPFSYSVPREIKGLLKETPVNLVETFNLLVGIEVDSHEILHHQHRMYHVIQGQKVKNINDNDEKQTILIFWRNTIDLDLHTEQMFLKEKMNLDNFKNIYYNHQCELKFALPIEPIFHSKLFQIS